MPKGPIDTPFDDYVGNAIPNNGKKGDGALYDEYSGIAPGDSGDSGVLGGNLTGYTIQGTDGDSKPKKSVGEYSDSY